LLSYSETFIPSQAEKFQTFTPYYAGFKYRKGIVLPPDRTLGPSRSPFVGRVRNLAALFGVLDPFFLRAARRIKPELVHAHFEESGLNALPLAENLKIPLVVTCHGYDVTVESYRWQGRPVLGSYFLGRRQALFRKASLCLGVSRFICDKMLRRGYPPAKVRLHYIGIDTARFSPNAAVTPKAQILFVGRLVEKKGTQDLLKAMIQVAPQFPEVELLIVGEGPLREQLETLVRENKLNVRFLGMQPPAMILQLMRESLLLCVPSVCSRTGDSEGLPITLLEALSTGLPVVATRHGGIPEAVEHGVNGLLCDEHDVDALAGHILMLLSDSTPRARMGQASRARIVTEFNLETQSHLLEQYYLECLG
jgi:colanic acid/amylovoran biosynthesis glycosyltransferase